MADIDGTDVVAALEARIARLEKLVVVQCRIYDAAYIRARTGSRMEGLTNRLREAFNPLAHEIASENITQLALRDFAAQNETGK